MKTTKHDCYIWRHSLEIHNVDIIPIINLDQEIFWVILLTQIDHQLISLQVRNCK